MQINPLKSKVTTEHKHDAPLLCCAYDMGGKFLFAGGRGNGVVVIELKSGKKTILKGHDSWICAISRLGPDLVLTSDCNGKIIAWDCGTEVPSQKWIIQAHSSSIQALSVSFNGDYFVTGDRQGEVQIWQASNGKLVNRLAQLEYLISGLAWHPDGKQIITADRKPQKPRIKIWDISTLKETFSIDVPELSGYRRVEDIEWGGIRFLIVSPDGNQIIACGRNGYDGPACALLFNLSTGKLQRKFVSGLKGFCYYALFHPEGFLMTASGDVGKGEFQTWNITKDESVAVVSTSGPCSSIAIHPDGKQFAVTQSIGKNSYPDSGLIVFHQWEEK